MALPSKRQIHKKKSSFLCFFRLLIRFIRHSLVFKCCNNDRIDIPCHLYTYWKVLFPLNEKARTFTPPLLPSRFIVSRNCSICIRIRISESWELCALYMYNVFARLCKSRHSGNVHSCINCVLVWVCTYLNFSNIDSKIFVRILRSNNTGGFSSLSENERTLRNRSVIVFTILMLL